MKRHLSHWLISLFTMLTCSSLLHAAAETFTLDNEHTYVLWSIKHLGFSTQVGKFFANGQLVLDKENPSKSSVSVTIKTDDIDTGLPELNKHLKSKDFFDTEKFPLATYVSNKVTVLGDNKATVQGMLTLHGVTKPVALEVTLNKTGVNPISNKMSVGFTATGSIKRSDFGITTFSPQLGDDINLQIAAEAYVKKQ